MEQTIITRHDVEKEQPEKSGRYLVQYSKSGGYAVIEYSKKYNLWNSFDSQSTRKEAKQYAIKIAYWWELPEVPRETEDE